MKFYKVKKESDQIKFGKSILVANELFTENEVLKFKLKKYLFDIVEVNLTHTYWFFGARFENKVKC